jgi:hypothetical protein
MTRPSAAVDQAVEERFILPTANSCAVLRFRPINVQRGDMNTFYETLPYGLIFLQAFGPAAAARRWARSKSVKSKWAIAALVALPVPALIAVFSVVAFILIGHAEDCASPACADDMAAFMYLIISAVALYLFGILTALMGSRARKSRRP